MFLLQRKAKMQDSHGNTPLHKATWNGPSEYSDPYSHSEAAAARQTVEDLLNAGVDVNAANIYGQTALHKTAQLAKPHLSALLLEGGACVTITDKWGNTPLHETTSLDDEKTARLLLESKDTRDVRNAHGMTPLDVANKTGSTKVKRLLLSYA